MAGKKLLVADDSLTIQKVIRLALSNEGYEIQAISDGADALQQISVFRPDLILIDVSLPTRTAFEIKRELNSMEDFSNTRFILMSSAFEKIDEMQADEVKFHGRLTKPFDPAHLRKVLQEVLKAPTATQPPPKKSTTKPNISIQMEKTEPGIHLEPPMDFPSDQSPDPTTQLKMEDLEDSLTPSGLPEITLSHHRPQPLELQQSQQQQYPEEGISISFETRDESDLVEKTDPRGGSSYNRPPESNRQPEKQPDKQQPDRQQPERQQNDEIKHLTESTIRMSGLDDFDWTVNDSNLKPPSVMDDGGTGFRVKPQFSEESAPPQGMPPISQTRASSAPSGNPGFGKPAHTPPPLPSVGGSFGMSAPSGISSDQLEEVIRRQVQETLAEMAQKILPEVAERVIKAEIHRLLNEKI